VGSLIGYHLSTGGEISFVGRYLLRALARQDLVVSLVQMRRPCIPTYAWLDMTESHKADRLLGYTVTLMPLLEELCTLAEEVQGQVLRRPSLEYTASESASLPVDATTPDFDAWLNASPSPLKPSDFHTRADSLRHRLSTWRPIINDALPFRSSRKFRAQAASYRAGALLYLHRLQNPPRPSSRPPFDTFSSPTYFEHVAAVPLPFEADATPAPISDDMSPCDAEALSLAHDIMLHAGGPPPAETKLLLWPVFLAACEVCSADDRSAVGDLFDSIATHRGTVTVERTRRFVEQRVWRARDTGSEWSWMYLTQRYPGECLPI
jgi:transcription factor-like protein